MQGISIFAGIVGVSAMLYLFLQTALMDANTIGITTIHLAQPMQKIALNHVQLVALAASFPLQWPPVVESLFATFGVLGDAGDYVFNPDCDNPDQVRGASVQGMGGLFFQKQLMVLIMPFFVVAVVAVFWFVMWLCWRTKHKKRHQMSKQVSVILRTRATKRRSTRIQVEMVAIAAKSTHVHHETEEDKLKWYAALKIQLWWDHLHHRYGAKIVALAKMQVAKERNAEEEARQHAMEASRTMMAEMNIVEILENDINAEDELVDALLWPGLMNKATFLDTKGTSFVVFICRVHLSCSFVFFNTSNPIPRSSFLIPPLCFLSFSFSFSFSFFFSQK